jgi:outer membrane immunogenic protein
MHVTRAFLLASFLTVFATQATAQEWRGFYIGGFVGGGWGDVDTRVQCVSSDPLQAESCRDATEVRAVTTRISSDVEGFIGGGQIGYNFEVGKRFVLGVEADIGGTSFDAGKRVSSRPTDDLFFVQAVRTSQDLDYLGTLRGRLGYEIGNWLLFATGGWAYGHGDYRYSIFIPESGAFGSSKRSESNSGWTVGGGAELRLGPKWSVKADYLFYDLGDERLRTRLRVADGKPTEIDFVSHFETEGNIVRLGFNYRFGDYAVPAHLK